MGTVHLLVDDRKRLEKLLPDACVAQNQSGHAGEMRGVGLLLVLVAAANAAKLFTG